MVCSHCGEAVEGIRGTGKVVAKTWSGRNGNENGSGNTCCSHEYNTLVQVVDSGIFGE